MPSAPAVPRRVRKRARDRIADRVEADRESKSETREPRFEPEELAVEQQQEHAEGGVLHALRRLPEAVPEFVGEPERRSRCGHRGLPSFGYYDRESIRGSTAEPPVSEEVA